MSLSPEQIRELEAMAMRWDVLYGRDGCAKDLRAWLAKQKESESEEAILTVPDGWKHGDVVTVTLEKL